MQQRSAIEQDVVELAREAHEIFLKQLELQREIKEIFDELMARLEFQPDPELEFSLTEFGVNRTPGNMAIAKSTEKSENNLFSPSL